MTLIDELSAIVGEAFAAESFDRSYGLTRRSDRPDLAQFQCNGALAAAKAGGRISREAADAIAKRLATDAAFAEVSVAGPGFINLSLTDEFLSSRMDRLVKDTGAGAWRREPAERIVIDYGGPNVAKPLHVGHLRAAIIGEALKRLLRRAGDFVISDIHLGDWGLPMGQLIVELAAERPDLLYFDAASTGPYPDESPVTLADLERLYPKAAAAAKADPARAEAARLATAQLQEGRPGYRALWRHFVAVSRAAIERDYADLGVSFDWWKGEADADPLIPEMATAMREAGVTEMSEGAEIIRVA
ncbi:MAG: arginine--tRNA ligase, partial [Parvularculaceae bacterium]